MPLVSSASLAASVEDEGWPWRQLLLPPQNRMIPGSDPELLRPGTRSISGMIGVRLRWVGLRGCWTTASAALLW